MAFEFLDQNPRTSNLQWAPITDTNVVDSLGKLCSGKVEGEAVTYNSHGNTYRTTFGTDGFMQQMNTATGVQRPVRIVPFFFEYEESGGTGRWLPLTEAPALIALTAVLVSASEKKYLSLDTNGPRGTRFEYEAQLMTDNGLCVQRNVQTGKMRRIRPTPVGPDGGKYFEFKENGVWKEVAQCCVGQLAAVGAGRGEAHYTIGSNRYRAWVEANGCLYQKNETSGFERPLRAAPWRGNGKQRCVDATDGYVPPEAHVLAATVIPAGQGVQQAMPYVQDAVAVGMSPVPVAELVGYQPASAFHMAEVVPMGTAVDPVELVDAQPVPMAQTVYSSFYQP